MSEVDFGKRSGDYAKHRPGFPESFYERLERLVRLEGAHALDLGTGPGVVALELARRGATVAGLDIAENQIVTARERAAAAGLADRCRFDVGVAERMQFDSGSFDLAIAGQCWHWFDKSRTLPELLRVLRPEGLLVVANYCYLALHSDVVTATEELVLQFNPSWTMAGADRNLRRADRRRWCSEASSWSSSSATTTTACSPTPAGAVGFAPATESAPAVCRRSGSTSSTKRSPPC